jgi:K+-transporting ATPase ATPase C chain
MTYLRYLSAAARMLLLWTIVLGLAYPVAVWGVGQVAFRHQANGSMVELDGEQVGSSLIGQSFDGPEWFHPRPSVSDYDPLATGTSNLAADNPTLFKQVEQRRAAAAAEDGVDPGAVPPDALTASGSAIDPHISPEYARQQVARVAEQRGLDESDVAALVEEHTQGRSFGFLGAPRVNVVELNLALEQLSS